MVQALNGAGAGLPAPQSLYPASLVNGELAPPANTVSLAPGQSIPVPRGTWWIEPGHLCFVQWQDPVTGIWRNISSARMGGVVVSSDGFNHRLANLTGCAVAAVVTNAGSNYTAATTVTPSAGNSAWAAVVGGALNTTVSVTAAGAGYGVAPLVFIGAPPLGAGVQATAVASIANGTISGITILNQGAGYPTAPPVTIYPNPFDPNYLSGAAITNATAKVSITGAGSITAILCTNNGASFSSLPTLTIAGAGASAAASICQLTTLTGTSVSGGGAGFNASAFLTTVSGIPAYTPVWTNPAIELTGYIPRPAIATLALNGTTISSISTIIDGGLFLGTPTATVLQGGLAPTTASTIALTTGGANATCIMQPLG